MSAPEQLKPFRCDKCGVNPIVGTRYNCTTCNDFDLCLKCRGEEFASHTTAHTMTVLEPRGVEWVQVSTWPGKTTATATLTTTSSKGSRVVATTSGGGGSSSSSGPSAEALAAGAELRQIYNEWPATVPVTRLTAEQCGIEAVTVYCDRAEVTRRVEVTLASGGVHEIHIRGLPASVDGSSVRVAGGTGAAAPIILEVSYETKHEKRPRLEADRVRELKDELQQLESVEQPRLRQQLARIAKELSFLERMQRRVQLGGGDGGAAGIVAMMSGESLVGLRDYMQRFETRRGGLLVQQRAHEKTLQDAVRRTESIRRELQARDASPFIEETWRDVTVTLFARASMAPIHFALSYLVSNARWGSTYEVRVDSAAKALQLTYHGIIQQSTGEDWKNVRMSLSTASPAVGGNAPDLPACTIGIARATQIYVESMPTSTTTSSSSSMMMAGKARTPSRGGPSGGGSRRPAGAPMASHSFAMAAPSSRMAEESLAVNSKMSSAYGGEDDSYADLDLDISQLEQAAPAPPPMEQLVAAASSNNENGVQVWNLARPASIEADNKPHKVAIRIETLAAEFCYVVLPSKSQRAFLKATARNTTATAFPAGPAAIFFDNAFVTQSHIKAVGVKDELVTYLGTDPAVKVSFSGEQRASEQSGNMLTGKSQVQTISWSSFIKNTKQVDVTVLVREALPRSDEDKIRISIVQPAELIRGGPAAAAAGIAIDDTSNHITWTFSLKPNQERPVQFAYKMDWPQGKEIKMKLYE